MRRVESKELNQPKTEALAWGYFKVMLPVSRETLRDRYKAACERLRPCINRPSNVKGDLMDLKNFYHDLMEQGPSWAFKDGPPKPLARRPNRGLRPRRGVLRKD